MPASVEVENKALIRRFYVELNRGNLDVIDDMVAPNYIGHIPGLPELRGIVALKTFHKNA
jgi:ketosteroid isomerase-like protein